MRRTTPNRPRCLRELLKDQGYRSRRGCGERRVVVNRAACCERLEALKERHEKGLLTSVEFLKELLNLARDVVSADARRREHGDLHLGLLA